MEIPESYFPNASFHATRDTGTLHPTKAPIAARKIHVDRLAPSAYDDCECVDEFAIIVGSSLPPLDHSRMRVLRLCNDPLWDVFDVSSWNIQHVPDHILGRPKMGGIKYAG